MSVPSKFSLFKRSNGFYYILFEKDGKRKWKSTRATLKTDALKALTEFKDLLASRQVEVTLSKFIDTFLPFARVNYSKCTVDFYEQALNRLRSMVGDRSLSCLTMQHLDQYKVKRLSEKKSAATVNRDLQALRAAMNTATSWKLIKANPFSKMRQVQIPDTQPTYFTKSDFQTLMKGIADQWLKELIIFAALTGMRRGEITNLRWEDVDLKQRLIVIQSNPTFKTKHGKRRILPMNDIVFNLLAAKAGRATYEYVFHIGGRKIYDDHACKKLKKYIRQAGLNNRLHFHSLRHTFASWLVQDGVSLYEVQKLLGHSNIAVTQVYSHLLPEGLHSTVNRISL